MTAMPTFQVWKLGEKLETLQGAAEHKLTALVEKYEGAPLPLPFEVALEAPGGPCAAQKAQRYTPLHRELFAATFDDAWLADGFRAALADGWRRRCAACCARRWPAASSPSRCSGPTFARASSTSSRITRRRGCRWRGRTR